MNERQLQASINGIPVGILREINGIWAFQYDQAWLMHPQNFPLSPALPLTSKNQLDQSTLRPVQWYFDNLLPEEGQRALLAKDARIETADAFGLLESYGAESAGSVTLLPPGAETGVAASLRELSDALLNDRIRNLPKIPLTHDAIKRMSLAGAQHKLAVVLRDGQLFEPSGSAPSTHILKPDHPDSDYPHSVINEWFVMRLAQRLGLRVPDVRRRYVPSPVYLIDRFDRIQADSTWQRLHTIDACQLLGLDRSFKYTQGSVARLAELANACRSPAVARTRLFGWLIFNVLVGNTDAHLKNLSFLVSHEGIQLAPFYDLLSIASYETRAFDKNRWPDATQLAWPILGVSYFSDITRQLLVDAGVELGLAKATAVRLIETLRNNVQREIEPLYASVEAENHILISSRPDLAPILTGELRCLRTIQYAVIKDMVDRLG